MSTHSLRIFSAENLKRASEHRWKRAGYPEYAELCELLDVFEGELRASHAIKMLADNGDIAGRVISHMTEVYGHATALAWFGEKCRWERNADGSLTLHAETRFRRDWISANYSTALKEALGNDVKVVR